MLQIKYTYILRFTIIFLKKYLITNGLMTCVCYYFYNAFYKHVIFLKKDNI